MCAVDLPRSSTILIMPLQLNEFQAWGWPDHLLFLSFYSGFYKRDHSLHLGFIKPSLSLVLFFHQEAADKWVSAVPTQHIQVLMSPLQKNSLALSTLGILESHPSTNLWIKGNSWKPQRPNETHSIPEVAPTSPLWFDFLQEAPTWHPLSRSPKKIWNRSDASRNLKRTFSAQKCIFPCDEALFLSQRVVFEAPQSVRLTRWPAAVKLCALCTLVFLSLKVCLCSGQEKGILDSNNPTAESSPPLPCVPQSMALGEPGCQWRLDAWLSQPLSCTGF